LAESTHTMLIPMSALLQVRWFNLSAQRDGDRTGSAASHVSWEPLHVDVDMQPASCQVATARPWHELQPEEQRLHEFLEKNTVPDSRVRVID
jgi:hypothetical protein